MVLEPAEPRDAASLMDETHPWQSVDAFDISHAEVEDEAPGPTAFVLKAASGLDVVEVLDVLDGLNGSGHVEMGAIQDCCCATSQSEIAPVDYDDH